MGKVAPKVDEAIETLNMRDSPTRRRLIAGAGLVSATAAASALLTACSSSSSTAAAAAASGSGAFPSVPSWQFWFVNHVTTNPFFVPTQYGLADAAKLLGIPTPKWTGSANSVASQMVEQINAAVSAKAAGIATTLTDSTSFTTPVANAMNAGIPVISYNADGSVTHGVPDIGTNRLCYVGQALYTSGQQLGQRIKQLVPTPSDVVIFIATPGQANIQPRYDGAADVLTPLGYKVAEQATSAVSNTLVLAAMKEYLLGHSTVKGAFAVDGTSSAFLGQALATTNLKSLPNGGFDTEPQTLSNISSGATNFTIYQDPYLQGFLPTLYLYLYNISGGTIAPPDTDTGLSFIVKSNLGNYNVASRYQGSATAEKYVTRPAGAITNPLATTST
jgi:simple sugar transport system substrate-binding protein